MSPKIETNTGSALCPGTLGQIFFYSSECHCGAASPSASSLPPHSATSRLLWGSQVPLWSLAWWERSWMNSQLLTASLRPCSTFVCSRPKHSQEYRAGAGKETTPSRASPCLALLANQLYVGQSDPKLKSRDANRRQTLRRGPKADRVVEGGISFVEIHSFITLFNQHMSVVPGPAQHSRAGTMGVVTHMPLQVLSSLIL